MSPYKPALLHESRIYQEFQRLAAYLNGTSPGTGVGVLSVLGRYTAHAEVGGDNFNLAGNAAAACHWNESLSVASGEAFGDIDGSDLFTFTAAGTYQATLAAKVQLEDTAAATAFEAGAGVVWAGGGTYYFYQIAAPSLMAGQATDVTITTPMLPAAVGEQIECNLRLNSNAAGLQWEISEYTYLHVVKLA